MTKQPSENPKEIGKSQMEDGRSREQLIAEITALREDKELYRQIALSVREVFWIVSVDWKQLFYVNAHYEETWGRSSDRLLEHPMDWLEAVHPEDSRVVQAVVDLLSKGDFSKPEFPRFRILQPDGSVRWLETQAHPIEDTTGKITRCIYISSDITEQVRASDATQAGEELFRSLFEDSPVSLWVEDLAEIKNYLDHLHQEGITDFKTYFDSHMEEMIVWLAKVRVLNVNRTTLRLYGAENVQQLRDNLSKIFIPEALSFTKKMLIALAEGTLEFEGESVNGTLDDRILYVHLKLIIPKGYEHTFGRMLISITDITQRVQAEKALQESEKRFRTLFNESPASFWEQDFSELKIYLDELKESGIVDIKAYFTARPEEVHKCAAMIKILNVNRATLELYKASSVEELLGGVDRVFTEQTYKEDFIRTLENISRGITRLEVGTVNQTMAGDSIHVHVISQVVPGHEETWDRVIVSIMDLTERVIAEQALHRWAKIFEAAGWGIAVGSRDGTTLEIVNPTYARMHGYTIEELTGKPITTVYAAESRGGLPQQIQTAHETGHLLSEVIHQRKDGSTFPAQVDTTAVRDDDGNVLYRVVNVQDLTERKRIEGMVLEAQKLADLGTLSAGIAHEINTPLQVITGLADRIGRDIKAQRSEEESVLADVTTISRNAWRVAHIIRSLLTYARPAITQSEFHDLNAIIGDTLLLIRHRLETWSNIRVSSKFTPDLPLLQCDRNQISQVLINLLTNAADAMPNGGEIKIQTHFDHQRDRLILEVADSGPGIPEELLKRVFDPFFTTKPVGEGTGLGLSISRSIIQAHGGEIEVQSAPKEGSTFLISLPKEPPLAGQNEAWDDEKGRYDSMNEL